MSETSDNNLVDKFKRLLEEFKKRRPKNEDTRTFLDIIRVYYDRFEERCSKILGFFLDPNAEHGLGGLFINALIDSVKEKNKNSFEETGDDFNYSTVEIHLEEKTDYVQKEDYKEKRIDINVETDSFVISIENKIDAAINNPFPIYVEHCEKKYNNGKGKKVIYVLLTLHPIIEKLDVNCVRKEYINVTYSILFDKIKHRIGLYVNSCNKSYLPFLFDFIKTLENKVNNSNMEVNEFISKHLREINELKEYFENFNNEAYHDSLQRIRDVFDELLKTDKDWKLYEITKQDILIQLPYNGCASIGIQCNFYGFGRFKDRKVIAGPMNAYIRVWPEQNMKSIFEMYQNSNKNKDVSVHFEEGDNKKTKLYFDRIEEDSPVEIASKLSEYLSALKKCILGKI